MIFITDNSLTITALMSRRQPPVGGYRLYMHYSMGNKYYTVPVNDTGNEYMMVFVVPASFTRALPSGEYAYSIMADSMIVTSGVARKKEMNFPADTVYVGKDETVNWYTVSISASLGGYLVVDGEICQTYTETVPEGAILDLEAVPDEHYTFQEWSDGETENPRTLVVGGDIELSAAYEAMQYTVSISAGSNGSVTVDGTPGDYSQTVTYGTQLTIEATPDSHYNFTQWSDGVSANPRTVTVTDDTDLSAAFAIETYSVTISAGSNGSVSVDGTAGDYSQSVAYGTQLVVEAVPNTDYEFIIWSDGSAQNPRTVTVTSNMFLSAAFQLDVQTKDEIWYTSSDGQPVTLYAENFGSGVTVLSNTYAGGKGVVKLSGDATEIGTNDFRNCQTLVSVKLPDSVTKIGTRAFVNSGVSSVDFGNGVASILDNAFEGCQSLVSVAIPDTVTSLGTNAFLNCSSLETVVIGSGVTTLPDNVFRGCSSLSDVNIPDNVTSTGIGTFRYSGLASVTFGSEIAAIGDYSFADAASLASITFTSATDAPTIGTNAFNNVASVGTVDGRAGVDYSAVMAALPVGWSLVQPYIVNISAGENGSVTVDGTPGDYSQVVPAGTQLTIEADPDLDYDFTVWSDGISTNPRTITVNSDTTLTAAFQAQAQPSALNTIRYTTTDGQVNTDWVYAYDKDNNTMTPIDTRYGRLVYDKPVVEMYIRSANAGNISSIKTGYMVKMIEVYDTPTALSNCTSLILKSPQLQGVMFSVFQNLEYLEAWYANNNATFIGLDQLPATGTCVTRTDNNLWQNQTISSWTFQALGTVITYEAQAQISMNDHNVYNRRSGDIVQPTSHTFADGVGTITYNETVGELRDNWSGADKLYMPDTVGYFGWCNDLPSSFEAGEYFGVVGGGLYTSEDWNYENLFYLGVKTDCTITVSNKNPILEIGTDGCLYNKENWMGLNVVNQTKVGGAIAELDMDDRCVDASTCLFKEMKEGSWFTITRLVLGDSCESLKLYATQNWSNGLHINELVMNDTLQTINVNGERITHASGGSNNPYLKVTNNGYTIESVDGTTLYWCNSNQADLSGYTHFAEYSCNRISFNSMPDISNVTQVDSRAFQDVSGVSTWVWPNNTITFNGVNCVKSSDIRSMEFGSHAPIFNNSNDVFDTQNLDTLVFKSTSEPTQTYTSNKVFNVSAGGTMYIPLGSDYSTWLGYSGNSSNIGLWHVKFNLNNTQLGIKHTPGVTITAPSLTGLNMVASADSGGWLSVTYSGNITAYDSTDLQNNADVLEVVLPDSCTRIGNGAFLGCSGLAKVSVSDSCTTIGNSAFYGTAITEFSGNGVTSFGSGAFGDCTSLESVLFGSSLATLGNDVFYNCTSLEYVELSAANGPTITNNDLGNGIHSTGTMYIPMHANYASYSDFISAMPVGWTIVRMKQNQILYQTTDGQPIDAPSSLSGGGLVSNTYQGGMGVLEYGVTRFDRIDSYKFAWNNKLSYVSLPVVHSLIDDHAFAGCSNLTTVEIEDTPRIGDYSFENTPITNTTVAGKLVLPPSAWRLDWYAYTGLLATEIVYGPNFYFNGTPSTNLQNVTDIYVYSDLTMQDLSGNPYSNAQPSGNIHLVSGADTQYWSQIISGWTVVYDISGIKYTTTNGKAVTPLASAFDATLEYNYCDMEGKGLFAFNGIVTDIDDLAFDGCTNMDSVTIPDTVTSIGDNAFQNCQNLTKITFDSTTAVPTLGTDVFLNVASSGTVFGQSGVNYSTVMAELPPDWSLVQS